MSTAKTEQQTQREHREHRAPRPAPTHLVAQSRTGRSFTRAGCRFEANGYRAIPLDQLSREQVERILKEGALDARLCTAEEADQLAAVTAIEFDESVTKRQLVDAVIDMRTALEKAQARITDLEEKIRIMSVDRKPNPRDIVAGQ